MRSLALSVILLALPMTARAQGVADQLGDPSGATAVVPPPPSYGATVAPGYEVARPAARPARTPSAYQPMWPVLVPGIAAFAVSYVTAAFAGAILLASSVDDGGWLLVPVIGPFVLAPDRTPENTALFITMGLSQGIGLALLIAGLAINRRDLHRDDAEAASVSVVPLASPDLLGAAALGRF
ncbi:MAG: hypothetical protein H6719_06980 [Sandaracinaceae bacterium]|nr:hypothetical protein [Sandaracinaceae bacterium]